MDHTSKKTCFVISPIGDKGSDVRKLADDVYELIVEPALDKFDFRVLRADKISTVESISKEVVELIQQCELCIVDITGHNPNVMYECGRRHETGKPSILIAQEGQRLPFDINTIRTFFYNLSDGREIRASVKAIQAAVEQFVHEGFAVDSSGATLATLAESVHRMERAISRLASADRDVVGGASPVASGAADIIKKYGAVAAMNYALAHRDPVLVGEVIPRLPATDSPNFIIGALGQGAAVGSEVAFAKLSKRMANLPDMSKKELLQLVGLYVAGANILNHEDEAEVTLQPLFESAEASESSYSTKELAFLLNQRQKLLHGLGRSRDAYDVSRKVLELVPDDVAYIYNCATTAEEVGDMSKAMELTDRYMARIKDDASVEAPDQTHLVAAYKFYKSQDEEEKSQAVLLMIKQHHPLIAEYIVDGVPGEDVDIF